MSQNKTKQKTIRICLQNKDSYILENFKYYIKSNKPISHQNGRYSTIEISSDKMVDDIVHLGITPQRKTYGNVIPTLKSIFYRDFIRGYVDGDGSISYNNHLCRCGFSISGYYKNLTKIQKMFFTYNIFTSFIEDKRKYNGNDKFGALVGTNKLNLYAICRFLYDNVSNKLYLTRKHNNAQSFIQDINNDKRISSKEIQIYYKYAVQSLC